MLKAVATKEEFDELSEVEQQHYEEKDEKYYLAVKSVEGLTLEDTKALKNALQKEKQNLQVAKEKLSKFEGIDDPDAAREALSKMDEIANWDPDEKAKQAKEEFEKQLSAKYESDQKKLVSKHNTDMENAQKENASLLSQLENALVNTTLTQAIAKAGGEPALLLAPAKQFIKMENEEGKRVVRVVDDTGMIRLTTRPGSQDPMSPEELVAEMKENSVFARAFNGSGASGSGATSSGTGISGHVISAVDAKDPQKYRAAKAKAEKAGQTLTIGD